MSSPLQGKKLGSIFVEVGLLDGAQEKAALEYAARWKVPFGKACLKMGFFEEATLLQGLAMQAGMPSVSLAGVTVAPEVLAMVPKEIAEAKRLIPLQRIRSGAGRDTLLVAVSNAKNLGAVDELSFMTGCRISTVIASDSDLEAGLCRFYGVEVDRHSRASNMVELEEQAAVQEEALGEAEVVHDSLRLALDFLPTIEVA